MGVDLGDLRSIRKALDKSQSQMAALLGVSTRAIQSYEQGWRTPPGAALKLAGYMLYLQRREGMTDTLAPCWEVNQCDPALRETCFASQIGEGRCCWLITGNSCGDRTYDCWPEKLARCRACEVIRRWLAEPAADGVRPSAASSTPAPGQAAGPPIA